jgi:hypothetical protein
VSTNTKSKKSKSLKKANTKQLTSAQDAESLKKHYYNGCKTGSGYISKDCYDFMVEVDNNDLDYYKDFIL